MQQYFDSELLRSMYMASVPLAILMLESDEEKEFMTQLYNDQKRLIYRTAMEFYPNNRTAVSEIASDVIAKLCIRCKNLMSKDCNELPGYIVIVTRNTCKTRLRKEKPERENRDYYADERIETYATQGDLYMSIFDMAKPGQLLEEFNQLTERDRMLINMRHIEGLEYSEMAKLLDMKEGALRTAVSRAKKHLEALIAGREGDEGYEP